MISRRLSLLAVCILIAAFITPFTSYAQHTPRGGSNSGPAGRKMEGQRKYTLTVHESSEDSIHEFNRGLNSMRGNRNVLTDIAGLYRSTFTGQVISASTSLLSLGINAIKNATKDKRQDWQNAVRRESQFVKELPMQREILDFYRSGSTIGPYDPTDMLFDGFGCRQYIEYRDGDSIKMKEVFNLRCKVDKDTLGKSRMLNHSKFQVVVDYLKFDYSVCDLPNDSLGLDAEGKRIDFSFANRNNLRFQVNAKITSSWVNQAMQIYRDEYLGEFNIVAYIDSAQTENGVFEYIRDRDKNSGKRVDVSGDCFLVPRSYVGTGDPDNPDSWGTGQYKVEMRITESCGIKESAYKTDGQWDKNKWGMEWDKIRKRKRQKSVGQQVLEIIGMNYKNGEWVTTLSDPMKTYIIQTETTLLNSVGGTAGGSGSKTSTSTQTPSSGGQKTGSSAEKRPQ